MVAGILLAAFAIALGLTVQRLREARRTRAVPILMYHKIGIPVHPFCAVNEHPVAAVAQCLIF